MTFDQAAELLAAVHDLQQLAGGLGLLLAQAVVWLQTACLLGVLGLFFLALRRQV